MIKKQNNHCIFTLLLALLYIFVHMKRYLLYCILLSFSALGFAQEHVTSVGTAAQEGAQTPSTHFSPMPLSPLHTLQPSDSLHLPALNYNGQIPPRHFYPYAFNHHWNHWELHKGLNVSLGASVFTTFGKHTYHGTGFSQNISAMYAQPITNRLSFAVGGYFNHVSWMHHSFKDAGISAILGYQFNERWSAYIYGQKSLVKNDYFPRPLYDMHTLGDRIGAAVRYNFSPSFYMELSVENHFLPTPGYHKQYDYPVPGK